MIFSFKKVKKFQKLVLNFPKKTSMGPDWGAEKASISPDWGAESKSISPDWGAENKSKGLDWGTQNLLKEMFKAPKLSKL